MSQKNEEIFCKLTGLEDFDNNTLVRKRVDSFIDLRVFTPADLLDDLVVVLGPVVIKQGELESDMSFWLLTGT